MSLSLGAIYEPLRDFFQTQFHTDAGSSVLFRFDKFGSVLSDDDFIDPGHPELGYLPAVAREKFSDLVNHIPTDCADGVNIVLSQSLIDETYYFRLLNPATPEVPDGAFAAVQADAKNRWNDVKAESMTGLMLEYKPSLATPEDWYDRSKGELWTSHSYQAGDPGSAPDPASPAAQLWRLKLNNAAMQNLFLRREDGQPAPAVAAFRRAVNVTASVDDIGVSSAGAAPPAASSGAQAESLVVGAAEALAKPVLSLFNRSVTPSVTVRPTITVGNVSVTPTIALNESSLQDRYLRQAPTLDVGNRLLVNQYMGDNAPTRPAQTDRISISFDYCLVSVRRPWYSNVFVNDPTWCIPATPKGQLSSGAASDSLAFLPIGFVAVKNLNIEGNWADADVATSADATDFGPFKVSSGIADNKLSHEGLQIIGWLLQKMPPLPPNDAPGAQPG